MKALAILGLLISSASQAHYLDPMIGTWEGKGTMMDGSEGTFVSCEVMVKVEAVKDSQSDVVLGYSYSCPGAAKSTVISGLHLRTDGQIGRDGDSTTYFEGIWTRRLLKYVPAFGKEETLLTVTPNSKNADQDYLDFSFMNYSNNSISQVSAVLTKTAKN